MERDEGDRRTEPIRSAARAVLARHAGVAAAYLFGSVARGTERPDSDVDVGIVYRASCPRSVREDLAGELVRALSHATGRECIDVVDLAVQGPLFCHRVLSEGRLLYEADRGARLDFESETIVRAIDFLPTYRLATAGKARALRRWLRRSGLLRARTPPP